ncbi:MAG: type II secretion system GspH family protein, partial [Candidatus Gastranaerophilales bacterium]|nr:type II secretion system GspH family protein [Candidatus Gastranaerophilales bacterium]
MKIPPPVADLKTVDIFASKTVIANAVKQTSPKDGRDCHADKSARKDTVKRQLNILATRKSAFTLAEVLITLVIIGVIAAITVPTLMANHQKQETAAKLKKFYSTLSNAVRLVQIENSNFVKDSLISYSWPDELSEEWWKENLGKYMPVTKTNQTYTRNGSNGVSEDYSNVYALNDGSLIIRTMVHGEGTVALFYDTNGYKAPNRHAKDIFKFTIQQYDCKTCNPKVHWATVCTGDICEGKNGNPITRCSSTFNSCNIEYPSQCTRYIQCNGWKL